MKTTFWAVVAVCVITLAITSCAKKEEVDTSALQKSFSGSKPELQSQLDQSVTAIKSQDYAGATAALQKLAANAELTDAQKEAIEDVLAQIQAAMAAAAEQAAKEADKAVEGLKEALPK